MNIPKIQNFSSAIMIDSFIEEYLSYDKLRMICGQDDISKVKYLEIVVDTTEQSLGNLGDKMPSLTQLKLNNSTLSSIRDLGTSLKRLKVLWLSRCNLHDLDGILAFPNLVELYLSFNYINDISPLVVLDKLEILDLEGNQIEDISQIHFLRDCTKLNDLTLEGNSICELEDYRRIVCSTLPKLETLDGIPVTDEERQPFKFKKLLKKKIEDKERKIINNSIKLTNQKFSPTSKYLRPQSARGPSSLEKVNYTRPMSARPSRGGFNITSIEKLHDPSSELTFGSRVMFCGNPVKSLRIRKLEKQKLQSRIN